MDDDEVGRSKVVGTEPDADEARVRRLVLVPRSAGPLRPLDARRGRTGDDLDILIDEVFGPSTDEGPGPFDVVLVVGGLLLVGWSWLTGGSGPWIAVGVGMIVLGVALPARSAVRAARARRVARREERALGTGLALDVADPSVGTLAGSYDALVHAAGLPGVTNGREVIAAGHAAVLEVASLLGGRPPLTDEERAYVDRRTLAIRDLTAQLSRTYRVWRRGRQLEQQDATQEARDRAAAVANARAELEATTGTGAVEELARLRADLDGKDGPDAPEQREPETRPRAAGPLVVIVAPFVFAWLTARWLVVSVVHAVPRVIRAAAHAIADVLRAAGHLVAELGRRLAVVLRAVAHQVARPFRWAASGIAAVARRAGVWLRAAAHAIADVLRAAGHLVAELGRRLAVVLRAVAHQVARPFRWAASGIAAVARRAGVWLRAAAHAIADVLRAAGHLVAELGRRLAVVLRAVAHQVARPFRWAASGIAAVARRAGVWLRAAAHAIADVLRAAGRAIALAVDALGRGVTWLMRRLRPLAETTGTTARRLLARAVVALMCLVIAARVTVHLATGGLRLLVAGVLLLTDAAEAAVHLVLRPVRAGLRAIATLIAAVGRVIARALAAAGRVIAHVLDGAARVVARALATLVTALAVAWRLIARALGALAHALAGATRAVAGTIRAGAGTAWGVLRPALRAARLMMVAAIAVAVVLPVRAVRSATRTVVEVLRRPPPPAVLAAIAAIRRSGSVLRVAIGAAATDLRVAIRNATTGVGGAIDDAREAARHLFGRPNHPQGGTHRARR